jgi:hypothetical protein
MYVSEPHFGGWVETQQIFTKSQILLLGCLTATQKQATTDAPASHAEH